MALDGITSADFTFRQLTDGTRPASELIALGGGFLERLDIQRLIAPRPRPPPDQVP
ncbi:MAG: hypothetical protein ABR511_02825 [Acidimicrobiales bacterium]